MARLTHVTQTNGGGFQVQGPAKFPVQEVPAFELSTGSAGSCRTTYSLIPQYEGTGSSSSVMRYKVRLMSRSVGFFFLKPIA